MLFQQGGNFLRPPQVFAHGAHTALTQARKLKGVLRGVRDSRPAGRDPPQPANDDTHLGDGVSRLPHQPKGERPSSAKRLRRGLCGAFLMDSGAFRDMILSCMKYAPLRAHLSLLYQIPKPPKPGAFARNPPFPSFLTTASGIFHNQTRPQTPRHHPQSAPQERPSPIAPRRAASAYCPLFPQNCINPA